MRIKDIELRIDETGSQSFINSGVSFNPRITFNKQHLIIITLEDLKNDEEKKYSVLFVPVWQFKNPGTKLTKKRLENLKNNFDKIRDALVGREVDLDEVMYGGFENYTVAGKAVLDHLPVIKKESKLFDEMYQLINPVLYER